MAVFGKMTIILEDPVQVVEVRPNWGSLLRMERNFKLVSALEALKKPSVEHLSWLAWTAWGHRTAVTIEGSGDRPTLAVFEARLEDIDTDDEEDETTPLASSPPPTTSPS